MWPVNEGLVKKLDLKNPINPKFPWSVTLQL